MARLIRLAVVSCGLLGVAPEAHHSLAAVYDQTRQEKVDGVLAEIRFINPHPFVLLDAADAAGTLERWRLEMDNLSELVQIGFTDGVLRPGDRVAVVGYPARNEALSLYVRRLDRPADGFWYEQVGTTPRIGNAGPESRN